MGRLACSLAVDLRYLSAGSAVSGFQAIEMAEVSPFPSMLCSSLELLRSSDCCINYVRRQTHHIWIPSVSSF